MSDDFFGDLGKSITQATQSAVDNTSRFFESQKISAQIAAEQKEIEKVYKAIGESVYKKSTAGGAVDESILPSINLIKSHFDKITGLKKNLADVKGMKICPKCGEIIDANTSFCPKCGAPVPVLKTAEPVQETGADDTAAPEQGSVENDAQAAGGGEEKAEEMHREVCEAVEKAKETVKEEEEKLKDKFSGK